MNSSTVKDASPAWVQRGREVVTVVGGDILRSAIPRSVRYLSPTMTEQQFADRSIERIRLSTAWICRSHDATIDGGSSKGHHLLKGSMASYPETTGYIIPTLYDAATFLTQHGSMQDDPAQHGLKVSDLRERCEIMAHWLVSIQLPSGAFQGGAVDVAPEAAVFNTGQIIFGLLRAHAESGTTEFLTAAIRAGDFLVNFQDLDGAWRRHDYMNIAHTYSVRVAWALLLLHRATGEERYASSAVANMDWALRQQQSNGWFANNHFKPGELPNTHGIAYVTQSLVEGGILTGDSRYIDSAKLAADRLLRRFEMTGRIQGVHSAEWKSSKTHTCVTGNIQLAITWVRLHQILGDVQYLNAALRMVDHICSIQKMHGAVGIQGGIPGSVPIWGAYAPMQYPNWAVKFWVDLLVLVESTMTTDTRTTTNMFLSHDRYGG